MNTNEKAAGANGGPCETSTNPVYQIPLTDAAETARGLAAILEPDQVTEVRVLDGATAADRYPRELSGYFDSPELLVKAVLQLRSASGIYFIPNPVTPDLLARSVNRLKPVRKGQATGDGHVLRRRWLLVDCDPQRPSGISANDAEHEAALARAAVVRDALAAEGWPAPIYADSGNGAHLMYRTDLPAADGGLVQRTLAALHARFGDDVVSIDVTVFNPARIWKLYGTVAGKGDDAGAVCGRPHRVARLLKVPADLMPVGREQLEAFVDAAPIQPEPTCRSGARRGGDKLSASSFDLDDWLRRHQLDVDGPHPWAAAGPTGRRWTLRSCPWNADHNDGAAFIVQFPSGAVQAGCHHNGCSGWRWHDLRDTVEPGWRRPDRTDGRRGTPPSVGFGGDTPGGNPAVGPDPAPLPPDLPTVMPFDPNLLPLSLRAWVTDIADRVQCPPDFPAVAAMVALAAIVGRKLGIRPKRHDDWTVAPNLWGMVIGRPGIMKTPALQEPLKPLKRLEVEAKKEFERQNKVHALIARVAEVGEDQQKSEIRKRLKAGADPRDIAEELGGEAAVTEPAVEAPVRRRYLVNDSSVEKLGEILNANAHGVLMYRDELIGLLKSLDKEGQEGARSFYLEAWNGNGRYTYDRIGRGTIDIEAACVSIIGGIQPGPLSDYLRGAAAAGAGDDGLLQRFQLAVWPDVNKTWVNVDRWPDTEAKAQAYAVYRRLDQIDLTELMTEVDDGDADGIPYLRFDDDAQVMFDSWRARMEATVRSGEEHPAVESHLAKYRSLVPSLALLLHLAEGGTGPVTADALGRALRWATYLESHARRIFSPAVLSAVGGAKALAEKLRKRELTNGFALRDVYRSGWSRLSTRADAAAAVELLCDHQWLIETRDTGTGGAPRTRYWINPKLYVAGEDSTATDVGRTSGESSVGSVGAAVAAHRGQTTGRAGDEWGEVPL